MKTFFSKLKEDLKAIRIYTRIVFMPTEKYLEYMRQDRVNYQKKFDETKKKLRDAYLADIKKDHEEDEIRECMMLYDQNLNKRTELLLWDPFEYEKHADDIEWKIRNDSTYRNHISITVLKLFVFLFLLTMFLFSIPLLLD